jgi:hypothetical protein
VVIAAAGGGYWWWSTRPAPTPPPAPPVIRQVAPAAVEQLPPPAAPAISHPVDSGTSGTRFGLPPLDESDAYFKKALDGLLGRKAVTSFLALDGFARRFVATINNLGTDNTAAELWPVHRTAGLLVIDKVAGGIVISDRNAERYTPFIRFVDAVDTQRAVALYLRIYPLFQRAYEDLGFPGKYFNDRVVEVIDHLLATPNLTEPIKVKLVAADGISRQLGPGGLYLFVDPALEASSSGQKILLRMGRANASRLKAKLTNIRALIAKGSVARRSQ